MKDYLRSFSKAHNEVLQFLHLHSLIHGILELLEEMRETMATQEDVNALGERINTAVSDLRTEIAASKEEQRPLDLSVIENAVSGLENLDAENAATTTTTTVAPAQTDTTTAAPGPLAPAPVDGGATSGSDAPAPVTEPAQGDATPATDASADVSAPAPADAAAASVSDSGESVTA